MSINCAECGKTCDRLLEYRCRICEEVYCEECSLKHFGLKECKGRGYQKNIIKSLFWMLHKKFFRKD